MKTPPEQQRRYVQAAATYVLLGAAVLLLTVADPRLATPERRRDVVLLVVALPFFFAVGAYIGWGERMGATLLQWLGMAQAAAENIAFHLREKIVMLLTLTSSVRALVYLGNALGWRLRLRPPAGLHSADPEPRMWLGFALLSLIVLMLARAWIPRRPEPPPL